MRTKLFALSAHYKFLSAIFSDEFLPAGSIGLESPGCPLSSLQRRTTGNDKNGKAVQSEIKTWGVCRG